MEEKRYQVFISSTFEDLKEERRAVQDVVISTRDFPVQMEQFPAADENQFEFIKSLINQCDYYILIIAGRYGSLDDDGLSYTHKEFRYAISRGVPVLVMLHGDLSRIEVGKSEATDEGRARLRDFIKEAEHGRLRKTWMSLEGLQLAVREALDNAKATKPRIGWVRGDTVASVKALEELNEVRKENEEYRKSLGGLQIALEMPPIPPAKEGIEIDLLPNKSGVGFVTIRTSWIGVFPTFYNNLKWRADDWNGQPYYYLDDDESCVGIGSAIAGATVPLDTSGTYKISRDNFRRLTNYYIEAGLMNPGTDFESPFTEAGHRIARRQSITELPSAGFEVARGRITDSGEYGGGYSKNLDDDIPF